MTSVVGDPSNGGRARAIGVTLDEGGRPLGAALACEVAAGSTVHLGREGDLPLGVDPFDAGVSRQAVSVEHDGSAWRVEVGNRNGAVLCSWGQAAVWLRHGEVRAVRWPRIGVRVLTPDNTHRHWALLEKDDFSIEPPRHPRSVVTDVFERPDPLTSKQKEALTTVFAEHLAWPPVVTPTPTSLQSAGARLGVSYAAVTQRLEGAQRKATQLGHAGQFGVVDPEYLFVLVRHGYVGAPMRSFPALDVD